MPGKTRESYYKALFDAIGIQDPDDLTPVFDSARRAGVREPGRPNNAESFALAPPHDKATKIVGLQVAGPTTLAERVAKHMSGEMPGRTLGAIIDRMPPGTTTDEAIKKAQELHDQSFADPKTYVEMTTPAEYFTSQVYGDKFPEVLRAALLSGNHPGVLRGSPVVDTFAADRVYRNANEPTMLIRTPGLFFTKPDGSPVGGMAGTRKNFAIWPRFFDSGGVAPHEMGHRLWHAGIPAVKGEGLLTSPALTGRLEKYYSTWPETQTELGRLKQGHYMTTGKVISNKADAEDFMQLLLAPPPPASSAPPRAMFGPRKGQELPDFNEHMRFWHNMMEKATPQDRERVRTLLPKVLSTAPKKDPVV
jgi:hypothetical protein